MSDDRQTVQDDLAFMRQLVDAGNSRTAMAGGSAFLAGGLIYGAQCFLQWLAIMEIMPLGPLGWISVSLVPTAIFLAVLTWILWGAAGLVEPRHSRFINAIFSAAGATNLVILIVIGTYAVRKNSGEIWMLYACIVFALQGAGWLVAYTLRRHLWLLAVALGWFASAIVLGFYIGSPAEFVLVCALSLVLFMALPGYVMMQLAKRAE
jgi:hypothetical protein